jgi:hypothetical protein
VLAMVVEFQGPGASGADGSEVSGDGSKQAGVLLGWTLPPVAAAACLCLLACLEVVAAVARGDDLFGVGAAVVVAIGSVGRMGRVSNATLCALSLLSDAGTLTVALSSTGKPSVGVTECPPRKIPGHLRRRRLA